MIKIIEPLQTDFLDTFTFAEGSLPFTDDEIINLDRNLQEYEKAYLDPDIEKNLISKNELLASYAISKAENSTLTLAEAVDVYNLAVTSPDLDFIGSKIKNGKKLTIKDYEKLEFSNIVKTFRYFSLEGFELKSLKPQTIQTIHKMLTQGMDIFKEVLPSFTVYRSGLWRSNNTIRVDSYVPAPYKVIPQCVSWLTKWLRNNISITNIGIFHTGLYALHPFNNGNKRVCRILEHLLLRTLGVNQKNLYSSSYYYHKEKKRYYKYLLYSLNRKNLNHFTAFMQEAIVLSIMDVIKTSLEVQRNAYLRGQNLDPKVLVALKPLVKQREIQYKNLWKRAKGKMTNKTFATYLGQAVEQGVIVKKEVSKYTYYKLNIELPEEAMLVDWVNLVKMKLPFVPDEYKLV